MKYKLASLFAGIGGIDLGFQQAGFDPVWANEIDHACEVTFKLNHPEIELKVDDIHNISSSDIPSVDILGGGFPCQPFSVAGARKGFEDDRGGLFFQIVLLLKGMRTEKRMPKAVFFENVKNLYTHDQGKTYQSMENALKKLGYYVTEKILNTYQYGNIPQNRERLFIVGFLSKEAYTNFKWPQPIALTTSINDIVGWDIEVDNKYYYDQTSKVYEILQSSVTNTGSIYQFRRVYVRENKSGVSPTLTANMGMGGHNVPIIKDRRDRIRKLTPRETLSLQGFPETFKIPEKMADSKIYKQVGNSVSVSVVRRIAENIMKALDYHDK
jgi:DNA (cytosine-5)-methyltransferase 1